MEKKHTVGTVQTYLTSKTNNTTLSEQFHNPTGKEIDTPTIQIHNCSLSWREKETSQASFYYEMIARFPTVSNTLTMTTVYYNEHYNHLNCIFLYYRQTAQKYFA